jgi:cysteine desulfurase
MTDLSAAPIYLDYNATTPVDPIVVEAMLPWLSEHFGNPSSGHIYGQRARKAVDLARGQVAALLGSEPDEIAFTSGGTESNNIAIMGTLAQSSGTVHLITSVVEHPATTKPCRLLERQGHKVTWLPVDGAGRLNPADLRAALQTDTTLVSIMLANNETGTILPVREISELTWAAGVTLHTDAAQAIGKIPVSVDELGVDLLSIAGHKLYAPKGIGALYVRSGTPVSSVLLGGGQERGISPGTENVPYIVGLGRACELAAAKLQLETQRLQSLRDEFLRLLQAAVPGVRLNGHPTSRLPNTLNVSFPNTTGSRILAFAPAIAASTGSACHEGAETPSQVLLEMGIDPAIALGAVRLSLGRYTTQTHVDQAAAFLATAYRNAT